MPYAKACEDAATPQPHNIVAAVKRMLGRKWISLFYDLSSSCR
jgi:hypothetical protein